MNSDLTGGKRRARHTPEQVALEQAVMRAQAERLSLRPEGLRGLLAQGSLPPPGQSRLGRGSPGGSSLEGSLPRPPGDTLDNATLRGWLHELNMETEAVDDLLDPAALLADGGALGGRLMAGLDGEGPLGGGTLGLSPPPPSSDRGGGGRGSGRGRGVSFGGGGRGATQAAQSLSTCHGSLLLGGAEHHVATPGQRVCPSCQALCRSTPGGGYGHVMVDKARLRMLVSPIGVWSKARDFFTRWEVAPNVTVLARRFPIASQPESSIVLFKVEEAAMQMDRHFAGTETLQALQTDVPFMMCSRAKTFCPSCNFASPMDRGCLMHSKLRGEKEKAAGAAGSAAAGGDPTAALASAARRRRKGRGGGPGDGMLNDPLAAGPGALGLGGLGRERPPLLGRPPSGLPPAGLMQGAFGQLLQGGLPSMGNPSSSAAQDGSRLPAMSAMFGDGRSTPYGSLADPRFLQVTRRPCHTTTTTSATATPTAASPPPPLSLLN